MEPKHTSSANDEKVFAVLGYIVPILFFIPLLNEQMKDVPSVRFHANQQVILLTCYLGLMFMTNMLFIGPVTFMVLFIRVINVALLILGVYGAYYAYKDEMKELPVIGRFRVLK